MTADAGFCVLLGAGVVPLVAVRGRVPGRRRRRRRAPRAERHRRAAGRYFHLLHQHNRLPDTCYRYFTLSRLNRLKMDSYRVQQRFYRQRMSDMYKIRFIISFQKLRRII
jgi:hypothetical protein